MSERVVSVTMIIRGKGGAGSRPTRFHCQSIGDNLHDDWTVGLFRNALVMQILQAIRAPQSDLVVTGI